jgi:uncharacterized protein (TIGR02246 family)
MTIRSIALCSCVLLMFLCSVVPSDDKPSAQNAEIAGKSLTSLAAAFNARDSKALSELFTPTGEFIDGEGNAFQGRDAIAREFAALFEINPRNSIKLTADDIREISPGVLTVDGVASLAAAEGAAADQIEFVALVVKQSDGQWLLASIRSQGEDDDEPPHGRLKRLEWLIGEWVDESDESTMHTSSRWSGDGHFIVTEFAIHVAGRVVMTGTQRIGWDGSRNKFKSWVFDSEGGHAEGIWTELDDRWVVTATGVRPDGDAGSATHIYERKGPDAFLFTVTDRIIGNESQPDFTSHVVRKPPEPDKPAEPGAPRRP